MSVLIKGMEMPKNCAECEWGEYVGNERAMCLRVSMTDDVAMMAEHRADFCPLVEVPTPHGRLIDVDTFPSIVVNLFGEDVDLIAGVPTVIEAEGSEE